jgi:hypothetical protein
MVYFARSPLGFVIASLCSMAIIAFTYFVIVKPQIDNANDTVNEQFDKFAPQTQQGQESLSQAQKLSACIDRASGNVTKIERCTERYR